MVFLGLWDELGRTDDPRGTTGVPWGVGAPLRCKDYIREVILRVSMPLENDGEVQSLGDAGNYQGVLRGPGDLVWGVGRPWRSCFILGITGDWLRCLGISLGIRWGLCWVLGAAGDFPQGL